MSRSTFSILPYINRQKVKADFIKMLSTPMADGRTELARRCFIFASLTSLSYIDVKKLYPHHISENSEGRKFIRKEREKTGVEFFVPLHPIAEKILSLYNTTDDSIPVFPLGEKKDIYLDVHTLGMVLGIICGSMLPGVADFNAKSNKKNLHDCNEYMNNDELRNTLKFSQLSRYANKQATTILPRYTQSVAWLHSVHLLCTRQSVNGANRDHYTNK